MIMQPDGRQPLPWPVQVLREHGALPAVRDEALFTLVQLGQNHQSEAAMAVSLALTSTMLFDKDVPTVLREERAMALRLCLIRRQEIFGGSGSCQVPAWPCS